MKKFNYQSSFRMSEDVKDCMSRICENYRINESDYIRKSVEQSLVNDMQKTPDIFPQDNHFFLHLTR